jgi:hypothetical protein
LQSTSKPTAEDFIRQQFVTGLFVGDKPVSFHGYGLFDLEALPHLDLHYFHPFRSKALSELQLRNVKKVMTLEYLLLDPEFRKTKVGKSLASLVVSLSLRAFQTTSADAAIGVTRNDRGVNNMVYKKGAVCLEASSHLHNVTIDVVAFFKSQIVEDLQGQDFDLFQHIWNERMDRTGLTRQTNETSAWPSLKKFSFDNENLEQEKYDGIHEPPEKKSILQKDS